MKQFLFIIIGFSLFQCNSQKMPSNIFKIIYQENENAQIDSLEITKLSTPLKALAAFYAAMGGTNCNNEECDLTTLLGLGKQGSKEQIDLIKKYFPNDKVAQMLINQDCYLRPSGASTFSDFEFITIMEAGENVKVDYKLMIYDRGKVNYIKGPDLYTFRNGIFAKRKRQLWKHIDN